jgi:hypothetical protein
MGAMEYWSVGVQIFWLGELMRALASTVVLRPLTTLALVVECKKKIAPRQLE